MGFFFFFQCPSKSKLKNTCARSIQIPTDKSKTSMSKCPIFPMARSVGTYGPLDKEDTGGQKLIPTGSLPATLQGATVCILVFCVFFFLQFRYNYVPHVLNCLISFDFIFYDIYIYLFFI